MIKMLLQDIKLFSLLIIVSVALIFLDYYKLLNFPKSLLQTISVPIQYGLYKNSTNISSQFGFVLNARKASQENKALSEQLALVLSENAHLRKKLSEARAFLSQEKSLNEEVFNLIPARPVGFSRFLIIDKGSDDGVKINQAVVFKDNFIGLVKQVDPKKSKVMLASDPDSRISAFSQSDVGMAKGILLGQFGSEMLLDKILHEEPIAAFDLVYSAGQELEIPRGLILGQVTNVIEKETQVFKQAKIKPVFDIADLDVVFVVGD